MTGASAEDSHAREALSQEFWDQLYLSRSSLWSGQPNPNLVAETAELTPGTALDVGCGEGADAIWLAERGWQVTAVDVSPVALQRAAAHASQRGAAIAGRIEWLHADIVAWEPGASRFDLVSTQFMHLPAATRDAIFQRLAAAVAPGGTLLIVAHHPSDLGTSVPRPQEPSLFYTAEQAAQPLGHDGWDIVTAEARPRLTRDPEDRDVTIHDTVLRARKRA
jgi:2-polyprenyl-3-methyl-5-hydroxy-6-metoxy-1,4-benzoquinol methylase